MRLLSAFVGVVSVSAVLVVISSISLFMNQHKWISSSAPLNKSILYWQTSQRTASILSPGFLFHAGNGLGNRILGMTTAVYRSMLTNRWLVVYWEPGDNHPVDFSTLFETYPTNPHVPDTTLSIFMTIWSSFSKLLMAIDNHLRYRGYLSYPLSQGSGVCLKPADKHICLPNGANTRFPAKADECELHKTFLQRTWHSFVNYWHTGMEWFMCDEYQVSLYARNGHYRKKLNSWVPSGDYFLEMSRLLFRPRKEFYEWFTGHLRQDANRFWLMDSKHSFSVGIQLRTFSQANVGAFLECFKHTLDTFESMRNASSVVVYLMADQDDVRMRFESQFIKEFGGNPKVSLLTPKDLFSTAHSLTERPCSDIRGLSREEAKQCMFRTLAELMIYSECDFLIQTARSTFSMVADTFRGRLRQYYGALKLGERSIYHSWVVWPTEYDANEAFTRVSSIATHVNSSNPTLKYLKTNKSLLLPGVCACIATLEPIRNTPIVVSDPDCISTSKRPSETERLF